MISFEDFDEGYDEGYSRSALVYNPDKLFERSIFQELNGHSCNLFSRKDFRDLKRKEDENI